MRTSIVTLAVLCATVIVTPAQESRSNAAEDAIKKVIADYNRGLNACDVEAVVKVWEHDGIFMPPNQRAAEGEQSLRAWYTTYCSRTVAKLKFAPVEVRQTADWAWARVAVTGALTNKATGTVTLQDNKALFVVHRGIDGTWRIARYAINSNKPQAAQRPNALSQLVRVTEPTTGFVSVPIPS
jgi:uncharacterized protein (TIGR02246 family)